MFSYLINTLLIERPYKILMSQIIQRKVSYYDKYCKLFCSLYILKKRDYNLYISLTIFNTLKLFFNLNLVYFYILFCEVKTEQRVMNNESGA